MSSNDFPVDVRFSLGPVLKKLEQRMKSSNNTVSKQYMHSLLDYANAYPELRDGLKHDEILKDLQEPINIILDNIFPAVLTKNEIKAAAVPFSDAIFNETARFKRLLEDAGKDYKFEIRNFDAKSKYILVCIIILNEHYGFNFDFSKPMFVDIPDKNGLQRHYKLTINADFVDFEPKENAIEITPEIAKKLTEEVDNIDLWKDYFPLNSWILRGVIILNLIDVTFDDAISDLKTILLFAKDLDSGKAFEKFEIIFKSLFNSADVKIGFTEFDRQNGDLTQMEKAFSQSFILNEEIHKDCEDALCENAFEALVKEKRYFAVGDVEAYAEETGNNRLSKNLLRQGVKSCILAPIAKDDKLLAVLEIVSPVKNALNNVNAKKLDNILPYLVSTIERKRFEKENRIKAVIQSECTSIHPSVLWVFEEEAKRFIENQDAGRFAAFKDIVFEDVYPLYGQIDIVGSSEARNNSIQKDITLQFKMVTRILNKALKIKPMPIYEQMKFRIEEFSDTIASGFSAGSESEVFDLLQLEVNPLLEHLYHKMPQLVNDIDNYNSAINQETGILYDNRKNYDDAVLLINQKSAAFLDAKQKDAQQIYPHYFERYKTDGVDHNIYIGASMNRNKDFNLVYLYNLRLWQLCTMCEMENHFYHEQHNSTLQLNAASMILVFSNTLSIKYRMDEKKFDVDGTYNARYEVVKKRIDKAKVKGTLERITQKGKIAIIYSQEKDVNEYMRYITYLQHKKYLGDEVENLELEDVQGVVGLKALRVNVMYSEKIPRTKDSKNITYADLMEVLD